MTESITHHPTPTFEQAYQRLSHEKPLWTTNYAYVTGCIDGATLTDFSCYPPPLFGMETYIANVVRSLLRKQSRVCLVGLGELLGSSMVAIASHFQDEIHSGRLNVIATNREDTFDIHTVLAEAQRRLAFFPAYQRLFSSRLSLSEKFYRKMTRAMVHQMPFELSEQALTFLQSHIHLVSYMQPVDTTNLSDALEPHIGNSQVSIVHESFGGFHHHPAKNKALAAVSQRLDGDNGIIITTEFIHKAYGYRESYRSLAERGYLPHEVPLRPQHGNRYLVYRKNLT